ncbi:MAG: methyltransferase [Alphaproteobacteria bacterium]
MMIISSDNNPFGDGFSTDEDEVEALRGERLLAAGRVADAVQAWERAVFLAPDRVAHGCGLLEALAAAGDVDRVLRIGEELTARRPACGSTRLAYARALSRVGRPGEAIAHFRELRFLHHLEGEGLVEFGTALVDAGELPEAIEILQQRLRTEPDDVAANFHLGRAWQGLGEAEQARQRFRRCLELDPEDPLKAAVRLAEGAGQSVTELPDGYIRCLFDQYADRFDEALRVRLRYRGPEVVFQAVLRVIGEEREPWDILDLGCGTGLAGVLFRPLARFLAGVDLSPRMVAKAIERGSHDRAEVGEAVAVLLATPQSWDLILAVDVLVYMGELEPLFRAVGGALRPGGLFAATVAELVFLLVLQY